MDPQRGLASATATRKLSTLVVAHSFYQFVSEIWHFVQMGGVLMSPRAASPPAGRAQRSSCGSSGSMSESPQQVLGPLQGQRCARPRSDLHISITLAAGAARAKAQA